MCGIAGIILKPERILGDLRERLEIMSGRMTHRGPDDSGIYVSTDGRAGLANRRLAIRDLSPTGHMPMGNSDGTVWITYNGEIYNADLLRVELEGLDYCFRSRSDTEVILHGYEAWGQEVVKHLRGMFAFAILDMRPGVGASPATHGRLLIARDHLGIKPLYYADTADAFIFASELRALLASGLVSREINPKGLVGYLSMGSVPAPLTIYRDALALEPACILSGEADRSEIQGPAAYWSLPTDTSEPHNYDEAVERVGTLLRDAVRVHLISDAPLGAFLSGGLDSSSVVALMRQATNGPIRTCTMVFQETAYSEAGYARAVAKAVGADHYQRVITADDLLREFDLILAVMDQPTIDGVNTYFVSQTARQAGLTVALSGLGGDELFGGYPNTFQGVPQMLRSLKLVQSVPVGPRLARSAIGLLPDRRRWTKVQDALSRPASPSSAYLTRRGLFAPSEVQALVTPELWDEARQGFDLVQHISARAGDLKNTHSASLMAWTSRAELRTYTHHQLLRDTDVMSMAHSLEVRVPLLDLHLAAAVLRMPRAVRRDHRRGPKPLLVQAMGDFLPAVVRQRRDKQGFTFPFAPWLRGSLKPRAEAIMEGVLDCRWLRPTVARQVFQDYQMGKLHWSRLWALLALGSVS